jgi:hypothetical protein
MDKFISGRALILAFLLIAFGFAGQSVSGAADRPLPGSLRVLEVPPKVEIAPVIDGHLDDDVWTEAAIARDFWMSAEQGWPVEQTEVLVLADERHLYIGFRVFDSQPEAITARQTRRDAGLGYDDRVGVELDASFNRRDISKFVVNSRGVQNDSIAGGRSANIGWKGDWRAAAQRTDYGWSAEIAIPFSILNFQPDNTIFGINFTRYHNRTQENSQWADVTPRFRPEEMGRLTGLLLPPASAVQSWTFMPYALVGQNLSDKRGEIEDNTVSAGIDLRYRPRPNVTGLLSINPDFSQVERQITDIDFSYTEKAIDDVRPFFEEGSGFFGPEEYFYSNRIPAFDVGARSFGRISQNQYGVFATSAPDDRTDFVARGLHEWDATHSVIGTVVGTDRQDLNNTLVVGEFAGRRASGLRYSLDAALTDTSGGVGQGNHVLGSVGWAGDHWATGIDLDGYDANYAPANALLKADRPGTRGTKAFLQHGREKTGGVWRALQGDLSVTYRETEDGELQARKWYLGGSLEFHNQIRPGLAYSAGPYRPVTKVPGVFSSNTNDDSYATAYVDFNTRSSVFGYGASYSSGELGGGDYEYLFGYAWWRPLDVLRLSLYSEQLTSFGETEQTVLVGQWDISPDQTLYARYIDSDGLDFYRLAYARRVRKGIDLFVVYNDDEPFLDTQFSVKLLFTYP